MIIGHISDGGKFLLVWNVEPHLEKGKKAGRDLSCGVYVKNVFFLNFIMVRELAQMSFDEK